LPLQLIRQFLRPPLWGRQGAVLPPTPLHSGPLALLEAARLSADDALTRLNSSFEGLLDRESKERLEIYGLNTVVHEVRKSPLRRLI
jgi:hypothetical protein